MFDTHKTSEILRRLARLENLVDGIAAGLASKAPSLDSAERRSTTQPYPDDPGSQTPVTRTAPRLPPQRQGDRGSGDEDAAEDRFLGAPEVEARYRVSAMTLWRWLRDDALDLPRPTWIRKRRYWREADLVGWERARAADVAAAPPAQRRRPYQARDQHRHIPRRPRTQTRAHYD